MSGGQLGPLIGFIRRIVAAGGDATDGQLLERFVARGEEPAFAALMQRHGPMVFDVCRRVLNDAHEAEDAFQATFLVLVRKAGSIGRPELLGHWLYGVAYRTALKARAGAARRRAHERQVIDMPARESVHDVVWRDLRPVLDAEVNRLPARYRAPFVLCCLEGRTKEEAACQLGLPEGTVSSRLARARERLRTRLARRGIGLSAGLLGSVLADKLTAAVPAALAHATVKAAVLVAAGEAAIGGVVSAQVAALTKGVLQAMFLTKLKIAGVVVVTLTLLGAGFGAAAYRTRAGDAAGAPADSPSAPAAKDADQPDADGRVPARARKEPPKKVTHSPQEDVAKNDREAIQGTWVMLYAEVDGKPAPMKRRIPNWVIGANSISREAGGRTVEQKDSIKEFSLDPTQTPKHINFQIPGPNTDRRPGIYLLSKDWLVICMTISGQPDERPADFTTKSDNARQPRMLWVFKRTRAHESGAQARQRLREEKAELEQTIKQTMSDIDRLKQTLAELKREDEARVQEEVEVGRLTLENLRLKDQLQRLTKEAEQLKKEQRSRESPTRQKHPGGR